MLVGFLACECAEVVLGKFDCGDMEPRMGFLKVELGGWVVVPGAELKIQTEVWQESGLRAACGSMQDVPGSHHLLPKFRWFEAKDPVGDDPLLRERLQPRGQRLLAVYDGEIIVSPGAFVGGFAWHGGGVVSTSKSL